ncbi:MAG: DUF4296 domain-containing protein [Bacteroidales bacterium]|nr:DUF4296 domain-containing protein [Bacteroidales bacterium]MCF8327749.1 DUF4296 domain-containing protein [Bacteroidales bacterium]
MQKSFFIFLASIMFLASCNPSGRRPEKVKTPDNIINHEKMVDILVDYHLGENTIKYYRRYGIKPQQFSDKIYSTIWTKHNISKEEFDRSLKYYTKDTQRMQIVYSDVMERLSSLQSEVNSSNQ